jgi:hypothetical protein
MPFNCDILPEEIALNSILFGHSVIFYTLENLMQQVLTDKQTLKSLDEIMAYENEKLILRYMMDYDSSRELAEQCFIELKRFLVVCAVKSGYKVTSQPIDSMWHTFLLFTKQYKEFCEEYLGRFINHEPFEEARPEVYYETKSFAYSFFGDINEEFWPIQAKMPCSSGEGG